MRVLPSIEQTGGIQLDWSDCMKRSGVQSKENFSSVYGKIMILRTILVGCLFGCSTGHDWSYNDISEWSTHYVNCKGNKQSPINIVKSDMEYSPSLANSLTFYNYSNAGGGKQFMVENNGHGLQVGVSAVAASITLAGLGSFNLGHFHFHWGSDDSKGSEHQFDGKKYPAELHLVHYKNDYSSVTYAKNRDGGLAVIGIMIEKGEENVAFTKFLDLSKYNITKNGTSKMVDEFKIDDLLPSNKSKFYRYEGSLTTPACDQTVTWTLFADPIHISEKQLNEFRKLEGHGKHMVNNYRPVQNLHGRKVFSSLVLNNGGSSNKESWFIVALFTFFTLGSSW